MVRLPIKKAILNQVNTHKKCFHSFNENRRKQKQQNNDTVRSIGFIVIGFPFAIVFFLFYFLGDEVIEWNGQSLYGRSAEEVHDIIADSKHDLQVELIVSRVLAASRRAAQVSWRQSHSPTRLRHTGIKKRRQCNECAHCLRLS